MFWLVCSSVICILYFCLIALFIKGWTNIPYFKFKAGETKLPETIKVSVVVACCNEEKNLPSLLQALKEQSYRNYELILIDDHSGDNTFKIMQESQIDREKIVLQSVGKGKKSALKEGIAKAKGQLIVTTDADCIPHKEWINTIARFQSENNCDLIIGPVNLYENNTFFQKLQKLEFITLIASGAGAAGINRAIMCNGANMAFTPESWAGSKGHLKEEQMSGDDVFLLHNIKKQKGKIRFLKSKEAAVYTHPAKNIALFFNQRKRWASKSPSYTDADTIITACTVFAVCMLQLILLAGAVSGNIFFIKLFAATFLFKYFIDTFFLYKVQSFFNLPRHLLLYSFLLSVFYPFYIVFAGLSGIIGAQKKW